MKSHLFLIVILAILSALVACSDKDEPIEEEAVAVSFSEFLTALEEMEVAGRQVLIDGFLDTLESTPIYEGANTVYFIYNSASATSVEVTGDFSGWSEGLSLTKLEGTSLWYHEIVFQENARLDYKFIINGSNWVLDPKNPNKVSGGFGPNSELAMPAYEQPWEIVKSPTVPEGSVEESELLSTTTAKTYTLHVYLPDGYDESLSYPTVYFQDGGEYQSLASTITILDNLIDQNLIEPVIGVFVTPTNRNEEYAGSIRFDYAEFFATELVPHIDGLYAADAQPSRRAVIGDSYGGNISAIISFTYPEVFGNCGLHSGAFQTFNFATNDLVMDGVKRDIRVASIWGSFEYGLFDNMRIVKDYLEEQDYDLIWKELPEGHSWGLWRATLDDMLIFFFPG